MFLSDVKYPGILYTILFLNFSGGIEIINGRFVSDLLNRLFLDDFFDNLVVSLNRSLTFLLFLQKVCTSVRTTGCSCFMRNEFLLAPRTDSSDFNVATHVISPFFSNIFV